jgi:LmbE family N-acetylglucosaminyl deacetylase
MIDFKNKKVLVLSPHPEDGEIGCGCTIQKFLKNKSKCWYVVFTKAEKSTKPPFKPDAQVKEMRKSTSIIGFEKSKVIEKNWQVRTFSYHRQEILDFMIEIKKKINPDIIFCHSTHDKHQDHIVITNEAIRAFKTSTILGYELPWNLFTFNSQIFIDVTKKFVEKKIRALGSYKSRHYRPYLKKERIIQILGYRGLQVEKKYAECFEAIRVIG